MERNFLGLARNSLDIDPLKHLRSLSGRLCSGPEHASSNDCHSYATGPLTIDPIPPLFQLPYTTAHRLPVRMQAGNPFPVIEDAYRPHGDLDTRALSDPLLRGPAPLRSIGLRREAAPP
jgi:hypothetical protein